MDAGNALHDRSRMGRARLTHLGSANDIDGRRGIRPPLRLTSRRNDHRCDHPRRMSHQDVEGRRTRRYDFHGVGDGGETYPLDGDDLAARGEAGKDEATAGVRLGGTRGATNDDGVVGYRSRVTRRPHGAADPPRLLRRGRARYGQQQPGKANDGDPGHAPLLADRLGDTIEAIARA
jgi:hypothetical protein